MEESKNEQQYQNVIVMRHGDRMDNFEPLWVTTAPMPWDPPLVDAGKVRAFSTGRKIRNHFYFPIHRVFVSPFLRCVQTAAQAASALCALSDDPNVSNAQDVAAIDPSKLKVAIEYGLCEMLNRQAIRTPPKDENWGFNIPELESILPAGTVDHSVERVYEKMPQWEEKVLETRARYVQIIQALANKYPTENLLLVTHGEGVGVAYSAFQKDATVYDVEYCGYAQLRRPVSCKGESSTPGNFEVMTDQGCSGISYVLSSSIPSNA